MRAPRSLGYEKAIKIKIEGAKIKIQPVNSTALIFNNMHLYETGRL